MTTACQSRSGSPGMGSETFSISRSSLTSLRLPAAIDARQMTGMRLYSSGVPGFKSLIGADFSGSIVLFRGLFLHEGLTLWN